LSVVDKIWRELNTNVGKEFYSKRKKSEEAVFRCESHTLYVISSGHGNQLQKAVGWRNDLTAMHRV
jgi:hypothetical protein